MNEMDEILYHDLKILAQRFYKIIEVNLDENTYFSVKDDDSSPVIYKDVMKWATAFVDGGVYPEDRERFMKFFNPFQMKDNFGDRHWIRVYYRRRIEGQWKYVCMEVIKMENYEDEHIVLIVVRDVDDYIHDFRRQIGTLGPLTAEEM